MQWIDIPRQPSGRTLRQFAALCLVCFGLLAVWQAWGKDRPLAAVLLAALALSIGPLGMMRPALVRPIFVGWMILVFPIGWCVSKLLLGAVFYLLVTPLGLLLRLLGRDFLQRQVDPAAATYWTARSPVNDARRYFRQF
jgi:Saxitoxin biosynthesis operon protein SxtJ